MKKLAICLTFIFLFVGLTQAQKIKSNGWDVFWTDFSATVQKRDRKALRKMMSRDFIVDENGGEISIDEAFKFFDDSSARGWKALSQVVSKGAVPMPQGCWHMGNSFKECRIAPPAARRSNYGSWQAQFKRDTDGKWYFYFFQNGVSE